MFTAGTSAPTAPAYEEILNADINSSIHVQFNSNLTPQGDELCCIHDQDEE